MHGDNGSTDATENQARTRGTKVCQRGGNAIIIVGGHGQVDEGAEIRIAEIHQRRAALRKRNLWRRRRPHVPGVNVME